jgi:hypothetical protein
MHDVHVLLHFTWSYKILIAKIANSSLFLNIFSQIVNLKILSIPFSYRHPCLSFSPLSPFDLETAG